MPTNSKNYYRLELLNTQYSLMVWLVKLHLLISLLQFSNTNQISLKDKIWNIFYEMFNLE
jgi:hypothetical protein